ncbi:hypothetical protein SAMN05428957_10492 [Oryzisolibacter propanilivorax]|uniref:Transposase n=1 Tax=Oryzisolibacter propanilivorax TaxID=1527607 RepID=A0A1G9S416_9BURK|nr:DUF6447 family protein [Oryzisolibacter propanilivorax]SDM30216.1 hypothetical protein SAMN05428957_10492 [Oryzisolibacter propanilivorax]
MPTIKIDDREFDTDSLSPEARQQLDMLIAAENRLRELQRDTALVQTARNAYLSALRAHLPTPLQQMQAAHGDTLKL